MGKFKKGYIPWNKGKIGYNSGKTHYNWNGGKRTSSQGYLEIKSPNHPFRNKQNYVPEHRLIVEKHLGRYLTKDEVIHHINEIKTDNRIENLRVMGWGEHSSLHRAQEKKRKLLLWVHGIRVREV